MNVLRSRFFQAVVIWVLAFAILMSSAQVLKPAGRRHQARSQTASDHEIGQERDLAKAW